MGAAVATNLNYDWNGKTRSYGNPDWMERLDDDLIVSAVSIPGTHHSASWPSTTKQKCQVWDIEKQLSNGVRFLDIYCQRMGPKDDLHVCYAEASQGLLMRDVFDTCIMYLQLHPREFIMMRVKESFPVNFTFNNSFGVCVSRLVNNNSESFWTNDRLPTVKEARGKVVILKDFLGTEYMGVSYSYDHVSDTAFTSSIRASSIETKMEDITRNMKSAEVGVSRDARNLYITFCSGSSSSAYPVGVAERINPLLDAFLERNRGRKVWGYVVMDFPGQSLINGIIQANFSTSVGRSSAGQPQKYEAVMKVEASSASKPQNSEPAAKVDPSPYASKALNYNDLIKFWGDRKKN